MSVPSIHSVAPRLGCSRKNGMNGFLCRVIGVLVLVLVILHFLLFEAYMQLVL